MDGTSAAGIGAQLREARLAAGLTQAQLAERSGIARYTLGLIERGHPAGELGKVLALAEALGMEWTLTPAQTGTFSLSSIERDSEPL